MDPNRYRFQRRMELPRRWEEVVAVLDAPEQWPDWWPQIRAVERTGPDSGTLRLRAALPLTLHLTLTRLDRDLGDCGPGDAPRPDAGPRGAQRGGGAPTARPGLRPAVFRARLGGDMDGTALWRVSSAGPGRTVVLFEQQVTVRRPLMRLLARPGRPLFLANHAAAMRGFRRGLLRRVPPPD